MKLNYYFILAILFILPINVFSQFDSALITKYFSNFNDPSRNLAPFGDQNGDGYGDFMAYDCQEGKINVFLGGTQIDTIPYIKISSSGQGILSFAVIDINHDSDLDIVIRDYYDQKTKVFYGGILLDSIADMVLDPPIGSSDAVGFTLRNAGDFNGDGYEDLMMYDYYLPNSNKEIGVNYFFSTYPVFDNIPEMIFCGDTLKNIRKGVQTYGDINGDGLQDYLFYGGGVPDSTKFMGIVLGNAQWDTTNFIFYYQGNHQFDVDRIRFIDDVNNDGKDDLMIDSYGNFYPYYYKNLIIYGNIPLDTIPDVGLNTQNSLILSEVSIGDVNGDGYNDFLGLGGFGYPNARLWLGGSNMNNHNLPVMGWGGSEDFFGGMINKVGDVDGDGVNDLAIGTATMTGTCRNGYFKIFKGDTSVTTGIEEQPLPQPDGFELYDPYPNPFNPETIIEYTLEKREKILIKIFDSIGKEVITLINNEEQAAGNHLIKWGGRDRHGNKLSSGVYYYQLTTTIGTQTKKAILLK